jgi:hypothetical protein
MFTSLRMATVVAFGSLTLAGCAGSDLFGSSGTDVTTSSVALTQAQRVDPACGTLATEIDALRREGVADKIERAAAKKYRMTQADLGKANQLTKANAEFQNKCSTLPRTAAVPAAPAPEAPAAKAAGKAATGAATKAAPAATKAAAPAKSAAVAAGTAAQ